MDAKEKLQHLMKVNQAFSPGAPIDKFKLFAGRTAQVREVITAVQQRGQHVILYGERGVGKTSLANVLSEFLTDIGYGNIDSGTINCDGLDTSFTALWNKIFREMSISTQTQKAGFGNFSNENRISLLSLLPNPEKITPDDVRFVLQRIHPSTIIIDEVDRIRDRETTTLLADTVKTLSDHSVETTIILVGVADSVDEIIEEHHSVERALVQVRMPRMSSQEIHEALDKGLTEAGMTINNGAKNQIAELSQGLPHYTHLLGLHAAHEAIENDRSNITKKDVESAIRVSVNKTQQSILNAYNKATTSQRQGTLYEKVLLACAQATTDDLGFFAATDVRAPMTKIMGRQYEIPAFSRHLNDFCEEARGPILQRKGSRRRFRFRFINPLMQPFIIIRGIANNLLLDQSQ